MISKQSDMSGKWISLEKWWFVKIVMNKYCVSFFILCLYFLENHQFPSISAFPIIWLQSKLVYEGHIYGTVPFVSDLPYEEYDTVLSWMQRFVETAGHNYSAPFWMGEFGGASDSTNWRKIMRFIREHDLDWAYWPIDGYQ